MIVTIFTSADSDLRLARRIQRDTVERGRNIQNVLDQVSRPVILLHKFHFKDYYFVIIFRWLWSVISRYKHVNLLPYSCYYPDYPINDNTSYVSVWLFVICSTDAFVSWCWQIMISPWLNYCLSIPKYYGMEWTYKWNKYS